MSIVWIDPQVVSDPTGIHPVDEKEAFMSIATDVIGEVTVVDGKASADLFDQIARQNMGISGTEFLARWDSGEFDGVDWDDVPGLTEVAMALPFAR